MINSNKQSKRVKTGSDTGPMLSSMVASLSDEKVLKNNECWEKTSQILKEAYPSGKRRGLDAEGGVCGHSACSRL